MTTSSQRSDFEKRFSQLLELFDKVNKPKLSEQLVSSFNLVEGEKYSSQLEKLLQRKLTANESFKIDILNTAFKFHGGDSESEEDSEEEEEE